MRRNFLELEKNLSGAVAVEDTLDPCSCFLIYRRKKMDDFLILLSLTSLSCREATRSLRYVEDSFADNKKPLTSDLLELYNV